MMDFESIAARLNEQKPPGTRKIEAQEVSWWALAFAAQPEAWRTFQGIVQRCGDELPAFVEKLRHRAEAARLDGEPPPGPAPVSPSRSLRLVGDLEDDTAAP